MVIWWLHEIVIAINRVLAYHDYSCYIQLQCKIV